MHRRHIIIIVAIAISLLSAGGLYSAVKPEARAAARAALTIAEFNEAGDLKIPDNIDEWVHLGSSLGMGYSQSQFDPDSPGNFQIAVMEPKAYQAFRATGEFADGTMFALLFYEAANRISTNRAGFVLGEPFSYEIHIKDKGRFPAPGYNFTVFEPDQRGVYIKPVSLPNACVECHQANGAYQGVFAQFYPGMRKILKEHGIDIAQSMKPASPHQ